MRSIENQYILNWERKFGKGKWAYFILTGLVWGTIITFIFNLVYATYKFSFSIKDIFLFFLTTRVLTFWITSVMAIMVMAVIMWSLAYRKYKRLKQKQTKNSERSR